MTELQRKPSPHTPEIESLKAEVSSNGQLITLTGPAWTIRWAAPELLAGGVPTLASDIWALGWICWETVTGNFPFNTLDDWVAVVVHVVKRDLPA
ncbi:hypothetical protein FRC00_006212, partial [Tulasnella sp. 408]